MKFFGLIVSIECLIARTIFRFISRKNSCRLRRLQGNGGPISSVSLDRFPNGVTHHLLWCQVVAPTGESAIFTVAAELELQLPASL
jgi:hypothetical protein